MSTSDLRQAANRMLDGMTVNKEKFARDCVVVCDIADRLTAALQQEQQKSAALQRELDAVKGASPFGRKSGMPGGFDDVFGDMFGGKKKP
jgi:hypothetical protein